MKVFTRLNLAALIALICAGCNGGSGGDGSEPRPDDIVPDEESGSSPSISNLEILPSSAVLNEGGGRISSEIRVDFTDQEGDVDYMRVNVLDESGSVLDIVDFPLALDGGVSGTARGTVELDTDTPGDFTISVGVVDETDRESNKLDAPFAVTEPEPPSPVPPPPAPPPTPETDQVTFEDVTGAAGFSYQGESWGASWGDLNGDGLPDIFVSHHRAQPSLHVNQGDGTFADITASTFWNDPAWVSDMHGGSWADFDNDGDQDFYVTHGSRHPNHFMVNEGGVLTYQTPRYDLQYDKHRGRLPIWFDFSKDGLLDYLVTSENDAPLARQTATAFIDQTAEAMVNCFKLQMGFLVDVTSDGNLDLICSGATFPGQVYSFRQGVPFTPIKQVMPSTDSAIDVAIGDFDNNLKNDFFIVRGAKRLSGAELVDSNTVATQLITILDGEKRAHFETNGDLTITLVVDREFSSEDVSIGAAGWNPDATVEKVGGERTMVLNLSSSDPDVVGIQPHNTAENRNVFIGYDPETQTWTIANSPGGRWTFLFAEAVSTRTISNVRATGLTNRDRPMRPALMAQEAGGFSDIADTSGLGEPILCASAVTADFDNDMDLDIYAVCRGANLNRANRFYENDGNGNFTEVPLAGGAAGPIGGRVGKGENVVTADYDLDGNVDLFVTNGLAMNPERVGGPDLLFRNVGHPSNNWIQFDLVGRQTNRDGIGARVFVTASGKTQLREQGGGYHRWSQNDRRLHFGLGANDIADVTVEWPSGTVDVYQGVSANAIYKLNEGGAIVEFVEGGRP
jgi:hypothetical protein